jgi:hypothetical protein
MLVDHFLQLFISISHSFSVFFKSFVYLRFYVLRPTPVADFARIIVGVCDQTVSKAGFLRAGLSFIYASAWAAAMMALM